MNKAKVLNYLVVFSLLAKAANPAQAIPRGSETAELLSALDKCHSALAALYENPQEYRFHQRPAVQLADDRAIFWINSTRDGESESIKLKARCVSDLDGGVRSLDVAQGHWR